MTVAYLWREHSGARADTPGDEGLGEFPRWYVRRYLVLLDAANLGSME